MSTSDANSVFLNVPFDQRYENQFVAIVSALIALGRTPRCVLEIAETGLGRLERLFEIVQACEVSIHDLSRVGVPVRFNMPFELGLACAVAHFQPPHSYLLLEREQFRVQRTLSDLNGIDPYIHGGTVRGSIGSVLNALRTPSGAIDIDQVLPLYRRLMIVARHLKQRSHPRTLFTRSNFIDIVGAGLDLAEELDLLAA